MNQELRDLFVADQTERRGDTAYDTTEYWQLRERDGQRRQRVSELLAQGGVSAPDDYFNAALIFQHGETLEDIWQAHQLARRAAAMGATKSMGDKDSLWLAAAALYPFQFHLSLFKGEAHTVSICCIYMLNLNVALRLLSRRFVGNHQVC